MAETTVNLIGTPLMRYYCSNTGTTYVAAASTGAISASSADVNALLSMGCVLASYASAYQTF
jgi:hypothetical protein